MNHRDRDGRTPLHAACEHGNAALVRFLLRAGAETKAVDIQRRTCLALACGAASLRAAMLVARASEAEEVVAAITPLGALLAQGSDAQQHAVLRVWLAFSASPSLVAAISSFPPLLRGIVRASLRKDTLACKAACRLITVRDRSDSALYNE